MASSIGVPSGAPPQHPGAPLSARTIEALRTEDRALRPVKVIGGFVRRRPGGVTLDITPGEGAEAADLPFQIVPYPDGKFRVITSTLANLLPEGFEDGDDPPFLLTPSGASGVVFGKLSFSSTTGEIDTAEILLAAEIPTDTDTTGHVRIGSWSTPGEGPNARKIPANDRYGPIDARTCWEWYADEAKFAVHWGVASETV